MSARVLIVEDERDAAELLAAALAVPGHVCTVAHDLAAALAELERGPFDVVVTDLDLAGESGLELAARIAERDPELPVLVVTAHATLDAAVQALRAGAFDFLTKPIDVAQLRHRVHRAARHRELVDEVRRLRRVAADAPGIAEMVGESAAMQRVFSVITRLGDSDANVLVTGESGVGKELVARALHAQGPNPEGPFVALNCAAVPRQLFESELFGHVRGAFTDAKRSRDGVFVRAHGGTLFLDEIGELPLDLQPKLLRALQERRVTPVGGDREVAFDVRVVSATNRDLDALVETGEFREDLFYRVNVVRVRVPPLRARGRDPLLLAQTFLERIAARAEGDAPTISRGAAEKLMAYDWPGNVRELENAMEHVMALRSGDEMRVADLPARIREFEPTSLVVDGADPGELPTLEELEARYIRRVLQLVDGNKTQAAEILGVGRRTLYRRLERMAADES